MGLVKTFLWAISGAALLCALIEGLAYLRGENVSGSVTLVSAILGAHLFIGHGGK
jgi:hypothetical protein